MDRTFSIIKPDATKRNITGSINKIIEENGLRIVAQKRIKLSEAQAKKFYSIHSDKMYDLTTAVKKLLALDTLNEDRERTSYHLQEVNFSMVDKPLVLTDEVKEDKSWKDCVDESLPF